MKKKTGAPLLICCWTWYLAIVSDLTGHPREAVGLFFWTKFVQHQKKLGVTSKNNLNIYDLSLAELEQLLETVHRWTTENLRLHLPKPWQH